MSATVDVGILVTLKNAVTRPLKKVNTDLEKMGRTAKKTSNRLRAIQVVLASIVAGKVIQATKAVLGFAAAFERTVNQLAVFEGSTDSARVKLLSLRAAFADTGFMMDDLNRSFVRLRASGIKDTEFAIKALADAVAAFGGGSDELNRAAIGIGQVMGKGVLSMEEMRQQIGEAIPFAMKIMAKETNRSVGELIFDIERGTVSAKEFADNIFVGFNKAFGGAADVPQLDRSITKVKKAFEEGLADLFDRTGATAQFGAIFDSIAISVRTFFDSIDQETMDAFIEGVVQAVHIVGNLISAFMSIGGAISPVFGILLDLGQIITGFIRTLAADHPMGFIGFFLFGPARAVGSVIARVIGFLRKPFKIFGSLIAKLWSKVPTALKGGVIVGLFLGKDGEGPGERIKGVIDGIREKLFTLLAGVARFLKLKKVAAEMELIAKGEGSAADAARALRGDISDLADETTTLGQAMLETDVAIARAGASMNRFVKDPGVDQMKEISAQTIRAAASLVKLKDSIEASLGGAGGSGFETKIARLRQKYEQLAETLRNTTDPDSLAAYNRELAETAALIDRLERSLAFKAFEKIEKSSENILSSVRQWQGSLNDSPLQQQLTQIDEKHQKIVRSIDEQIQKLMQLKVISAETAELMADLEVAREMAAESAFKASEKARREADKAFQATKDFYGSLLDTLENGLASALEGLANGTKTLGDVMTEMFANITAAAAQYLAKLIMIKAIEAVLNFVAPGAGTAAAAALTEGGFMGGSAKGNAFSGGITPFAKGGIISGPTLFGLAGEAGDEAIMPLTRIGGKLGVNTAGGSGGDTYHLTVKAIDTQSGMQFLQRNADALVSQMSQRNKLNRGSRRQIA